MFILVLRVVIVFGLLTAIYLALSVYMRWDRRKTLEEEHAEGAAPALTREDYVMRGLAEYERSWSKRVLVGIFLVPLVVTVIAIVITSLN